MGKVKSPWEHSGSEWDAGSHEEEVSPGLFIRRRSLFSLAPAIALGAIAALYRQSARAGEGARFAEVLAKANKRMPELIGDTSDAGQARYLHELAALASQMSGVPQPAGWNDSEQGETEGTFIGVVPGGEPFTVLQWRMLPHTKIRFHAHTYGNVVTLGLEGSARVRNFEVVGAPDYAATGTFKVRQTVDQVLEPGRTNLVSLERNYIHGFEAGPDGARGLDITTRIRPKPAGSTPFLDIKEAMLADGIHHSFDATWAYDA